MAPSRSRHGNRVPTASCSRTRRHRAEATGKSCTCAMSRADATCMTRSGGQSSWRFPGTATRADSSTRAFPRTAVITRPCTRTISAGARPKTPPCSPRRMILRSCTRSIRAAITASWSSPRSRGPVRTVAFIYFPRSREVCSSWARTSSTRGISSTRGMTRCSFGPTATRRGDVLRRSGAMGRHASRFRKLKTA
jgi:hypothetical protein